MASPPCSKVRAAARRARGLGCAAVAIALATGAAPTRADDFSAVYRAYWAGLPAAEIRLAMHDGPTEYRDEIEIRSEGLPALVTHFRGSARTEGSLAADKPPAPLRYESVYDLRKRRNSHLSMRFVGREGAVFADRGPGDTSRKPALPEAFRRNVVDPMTALSWIRHELRLRPRGSFTIQAYDGARRFDVLVRVLPKGGSDGALRLELTLRPIAGFKGESSEDGDPDTAPRTVALSLTDDARLMPLSMSVPIYYLPLVVQIIR